MSLVHIFEDNERLPEVPMPRVPELPKPIATVWAACDSGAIYVSPPDDWTMFRRELGVGSLN